MHTCSLPALAPLRAALRCHGARSTAASGAARTPVRCTAASEKLVLARREAVLLLSVAATATFARPAFADGALRGDWARTAAPWKMLRRAAREIAGLTRRVADDAPEAVRVFYGAANPPATYGGVGGTTGAVARPRHTRRLFAHARLFSALRSGQSSLQLRHPRVVERGSGVQDGEGCVKPARESIIHSADSGLAFRARARARAHARRHCGRG
jgi:hypothetical protein